MKIERGSAMAVSYLIASDLHGDGDCVKALLARFEEEKESIRREGGDLRLLLLGDLLYHGPRNPLPGGYTPKEVAALLNEKKNELFCVRGNCDAEVDQMLLEFPIFAEYALVTVGKRLLFATHGHRFSKDHLPPLRRGDLLAFGHTHLPMMEREEKSGILCLNPGSVSLPKGGSERGYLLLTPAQGGRVFHKSLDGRLLGTCALEEGEESASPNADGERSFHGGRE